MSDPTLYNDTIRDISGKTFGYNVLFLDSDGIIRRVPDGGVIEVSGVVGSTFTVGGKPVMLADGTSSDGSNDSILSLITLQNAYLNSPNSQGNIALQSNRDLTLSNSDSTATYLRVIGATGEMFISSDININSDHIGIVSNDFSASSFVINWNNQTQSAFRVNISTEAAGNVYEISDSEGTLRFAVDVNGNLTANNLSINKINNVVWNDFVNGVQNHLATPAPSPFKHSSSEISLTSQLVDTFNLAYSDLDSFVGYVLANIGNSGGTDPDLANRVTNVESSVAAINTTINAINSSITQLETRIEELNVKAIKFTQATASTTWTIQHMMNTTEIQFSVYDENNFSVVPHEAYSLSPEVFVINFMSPQSGKAILAFLLDFAPAG